jgi:hypothetical protein
VTDTHHSAVRQNLSRAERKSVTRPKVAICFFGITRNFSKHTLDSIKRNLFETAARRDSNFRRLAHFNRLDAISSHRSGENSVLIDPQEFKLLGCDVVAQTDQDEVDKGIDFDYVRQFGDNWRDNYASLKNLLRQFYSLNAVTDLLLAEKTDFELVIFSRADLRFEAPVEIPRIRRRTLYTPWFQRYHGLNDRFAMGDLETMVAYGRRQSMIRQYCEEAGGPLRAEGYLLWYAKKCGLSSRHLKSINFSRVRSDGQVLAVDCSREEKLKFYFKRGLEALGLRRH